MSEQFSPELFLPHVDKPFRVRGGRHVLTLVQVDAAAAERAKRAPRPPVPLEEYFKARIAPALCRNKHRYAQEVQAAIGDAP